MKQEKAKRWASLFVAASLVTIPIEIGSETFTLTTVYPSPSGIYTTLVTTGNPPAGAAQNSIFSRNGGNVFMTPGGGLNNKGYVGIGTTIVATDNTRLADTSTKLYVNGDIYVTGKVMMVDGSQGAGKVLTSNAAGLGTWQNPTSGLVPICASKGGGAEAVATCPAGKKIVWAIEDTNGVTSNCIHSPGSTGAVTLPQCWGLSSCTTNNADPITGIVVDVNILCQ